MITVSFTEGGPVTLGPAQAKALGGRIKALRKAGLADEEIAAKLGIARGAVGILVRSLGIGAAPAKAGELTKARPGAAAKAGESTNPRRAIATNNERSNGAAKSVIGAASAGALRSMPAPSRSVPDPAGAKNALRRIADLRDMLAETGGDYIAFDRRQRAAIVADLDILIVVTEASEGPA
jgi:hypothetical protein